MTWSETNYLGSGRSAWSLNESAGHGHSGYVPGYGHSGYGHGDFRYGSALGSAHGVRDAGNLWRGNGTWSLLAPPGKACSGASLPHWL